MPIDAQYYFDFESCCMPHSRDSLGSWRQVPAGRWTLDTTNVLAGQSSLRHAHDNPEAGCDWLVLRHGYIDAAPGLTLSFQIRHAYDPSAANNWQLYLGASFTTGETGNDPDPQEGLVLGVNYKGSSDLLSLWELVDGEVRATHASILNYQEGVGTEKASSLRLEISEGGRVAKLFLRSQQDSIKAGDGTDSGVSMETAGRMGSPDSLELLGTFELDGLPGGAFLMLRYQYSSARDRSLWLDELYLDAAFTRDSLPPGLEHLMVTGKSSLELLFDESLAPCQRSSFRLKESKGSSFLLPLEVDQEAGRVQLDFASDIPNRKEQLLLITGVEDEAGNRMQDSLCSFLRNEAQWGDAVINELLADPFPSPIWEREYLELYNRSLWPLDAGEWSIRSGQHSYPLTRFMERESLLMGPGDFLILEGISLPNEGGELGLFSEEGILLHSLEYGHPPGEPAWKGEGGWSLELPDPDAICNSGSHLRYSHDAEGGTPGKVNSLQWKIEEEVAELAWWGVDCGDSCLQLSFTGRVFDPEIPDLQDKNGVTGLPLTQNVGWIVQPSFSALSVLEDRWSYHHGRSIFEQGGYELSIEGLRDCSSGEGLEILVGGQRAIEAEPGSLYISEVMFHPIEGEAEFIELLVGEVGNVDLKDFSLRVAGGSGDFGAYLPLSQGSRIVAPGSYLLLTRDEPLLRACYSYLDAGVVVEVRDLPALQNSEGSLLLLGEGGEQVDLLRYTEDMHSPLLASGLGVSLERISLQEPGWKSANWHSAASYCLSTPGGPNSQALDPVEGEELLQLSPQSFSPDDDGFEDVLSIRVCSGISGCLLDVMITDAGGRPVRSLARLELGGPEALYFWDGRDEEGRRLPTGFYLVHLQCFDAAGGVFRRKRKAIGLYYR